MDEIMLMEYLKNKDTEGINKRELISKFKEYMNNRGGRFNRYMGDYITPEAKHLYERKHSNYPEDLMNTLEYDRDNRYNRLFERMTNNMSEEDFNDFIRSIKRGDEHFNDSYANYIVSEMYHYENGRKHSGEKYNMEKAKNVKEKYKKALPDNITCADVYVAINSHYHDYCSLFKVWFGDNIDQKIIESAIVFFLV